MHCKLKKCRKAAIAGLVAGAGMAASAVSLEPLSGSVINSAEGQDLIMVVRSNSVIRVKEAGMIDLLVVGGGGGGGGGGYDGAGGGGGGGQVVYSRSVPISVGNHEIVIGAGGAVNNNGSPSSAFGLTAIGGGAGGYSGSADGKAGGNGGGAAVYQENSTSTKVIGTAGSGAEGGYAGGGGVFDNLAWTIYGGGGGGAGGVGGTPVVGDSTPGFGGVGLSCAISGKSLMYGGGGGGACIRCTTPPKGGEGGGGTGVWYKDVGGIAHAATAGQDFTGGGGGGGGTRFQRKAAAGGCGVVIIRYRANATKSITLQDGEASGGEKTVKKHFGIHTFRKDGKFTLDRDATLDILLVGGGGGGGSGRGGGGGGGGVMMLTNVFCKAGSYDITVGAGGAQNASGVGSSFVRTDALQSTQYEVLGGGAGGNGEKATINGKVGASGGGGGCGSHQSTMESVCGVGEGGAGTQYQGHAGGAASASGQGFPTFGGGGGGAGTPGGDAFASANTSVTPHVFGKGGDGLPCDFSGTLCYYGGGGSGGDGLQHQPGTPGGLGGGGVGGHGEIDYSGSSHTAGGDGEPNTGGGGGGGGGYAWTNDPGGAGGSGIVIVRYNLPKKGLIVILR